MSQLTYTTTCIAHSDKIGIDFSDCNDSTTMTFSKNGSSFLSVTMSRKQLDLLMDNAEDYLDRKHLARELERFWEDL